MATMILPAIAYVVFALCFLAATLLMRVDLSSEVYDAAVTPFVKTPWKRHPDQMLKDVRGGPEVYEWLKQVWVNQVFKEFPAEGDANMYCMGEYKCNIDEGPVQSTAACATNLQKGTRNCPTWMGSDFDCCEPCQDSEDKTCGNYQVTTQSLQMENTTSVSDLSANCAEDMPSWLQDLAMWKSEDKGTSSDVDSDVTPDFRFCPERLPKYNYDILTSQAASVRSLSIANFNNVLMARFSMKRFDIQEGHSKRFKSATPVVVGASHMDAWNDNGKYENKETFGDGGAEFQYQEGGGFYSAGAFVATFGFHSAKTRDAALEQIAYLEENHWFDLNQGSFALEMVLFNGNVDKFMYIRFIFQHTFAGDTLVDIGAGSLELTLHDLSMSITYVRLILYALIVVLFVYFLKNEFEDMSADYAAYFSSFMAIVHIVSLVLCGFVILNYIFMAVDFTFTSFSFPLPEDQDEAFAIYSRLVELSKRLEAFMESASVNILLIFVRLVWIANSLVPETGIAIVFNTFGQVSSQLVGFFSMFLILVGGFTFSGYFLFGTKMWRFGSLSNSFVTTVKCILRESLFDELVVADPTLGFWFNVLFHLFFLIVLSPMLSIILYGYATEKQRMKSLPHTDGMGARRFLRQMKFWLGDSSAGFNRIYLAVNQKLFGSSEFTSMRINYEQVARLRDRRVTRPRLRNVVYEPKGDDALSSNPMKDLVLKSVEPFYPNGWMQYYVADCVKDGLADEAHVKEGFRLIGIEQKGPMDFEEFRSPEKFHSMEETGYKGDTKNILAELQLPVTLEFEGGVKPYSCASLNLIIFIVIFMSWGNLILRTQDRHLLTKAHHDVISSPTWVEYNPERLVNFMSMDRIDMLPSWTEHAILDGQYSCISPLAQVSGCLDSLRTEVRSDWFLWSGEGNMHSEPKRLDTLPLDTTPKAAQGLSLGYIPLTTPASTKENVPVNELVRLHGYNVGVMPNNQVRLTIQAACFEKNDHVRFKAEYPYMIHRYIKTSWNCANEPCMKDMIDARETCYSREGHERDPSFFEGTVSGVKYQYNEELSFAGLGGIVVGLGGTQAEARTVLNTIENDRIMDNGASSFVFEFVTYNGNLDQFTYTQSTVNLAATGLLYKKVHISVFPLVLFNDGAQPGLIRSSMRTAYTALFAIYFFFVIVFIIYLLSDLVVQYQITKELQRPPLMFMVDFFTDDWWNFIDVVSTICNVMVIISLIKFVSVESGFDEISTTPFTSWTLEKYTFKTTVDLNDVEPMRNFQRAASLYNTFTNWVAMNGLFMMLRIIKYFGAVPQLRLMMITLSSAFSELAIVTAIMFVMCLGFSFLFFTRFGILFSKQFGSPYKAFTEQFLYICGSFKNTEEIRRANPIDFSFCFIVFQVVFFLLNTLYLAALAYRWKDSRKDAQEFSIQSTTAKFYEATQLQSRRKDDKKKETRRLDKEFWQSCSVLTHICLVEESGRINAVDRKGGMSSRTRANGDGAKDGGEAAADEEYERDEEGLDLETSEGQAQFLKIFKKAHMEIASKLCRDVAVGKVDQGAGVGDLGPAGSKDDWIETPEDAQYDDDDLAPIEIGIVEEPVENNVAAMITQKLAMLLQEEEHFALEVALDALVTVLESADTLKRLQEFFLPKPMIFPKKPQEWGKFNQKKLKMESALDLFLKWLQEETRIKHYRTLKDSAAAKERVLKQQSLVLTDYLEQLDKQISKLQDDIKVLEKDNEDMRKHVLPLLNQ